MTDHRLALLLAALGFLQLPSRTPELQMMHRWLDTWTGLGLIVVGVERQGLRLSLSHIAEGEWRRSSWAIRCSRLEGLEVAKTPWQAVQQAGWSAMRRV
jgi:hypothetical protein